MSFACHRRLLSMFGRHDFIVLRVSEKVTLKSPALILKGKGRTQLKEVLEYFVRALVGAKLLEMASAMAGILF